MIYYNVTKSVNIKAGYKSFNHLNLASVIKYKFDKSTIIVVT